MSKRFSDRIIQFLHHPEYKPMQAQRLARAMGIAEAEYGDFHDAVDALRRVGRVVLGTGSAVMLPQPRGQIVGTYRANPKGFGFVVPDEATVHGDVFIPPGSGQDAVTGDKVLCRVVERGQRGGKKAFGGWVIKVIERGESRFVGRLEEEAGTWFVRPDGNALHVPILIADPGAKSARTGDQVVAEIVRYPREGRPARGVIVERLGKAGRPEVDLLSVIRQFHLPDVFPDDVLTEARSAVRGFHEPSDPSEREDLSHLTTVTIDPDDARDFDDAVTLERLSQHAEQPIERGKRPVRQRRSSSRSADFTGETPVPQGSSGSGSKAAKTGDSVRDGAAVWELGVHIADVSHFVQLGGIVDEEARTRGTSVYFPGHVIPMLPEVLSNGVCSLQEDEPRLCKSAFLRYDDHGRLVGRRFANTVIRSAKRLTYTQATAILEGRDQERRQCPPAVVELLGRIDRLARAIRQRRLEHGMLELDLPEVEVVLDEEGRAVEARPADTSFSHKIIEMFMVEANEAVGRLLRDLGVPFLRRIHPEPDEDSLEAMARFVKASGVPLPPRLGSKELQGLLESLRGRPEAYAVNLAVLKSLQLAEYSPEDVGHFGLASDCYTHFTSPIRRYPDLMVHRLLEMYLRGRLRRRAPVADEETPDEQSIQDQGRRMSYLARRAEHAEQELKTLKILQLMAKQVGEEFEGVVSGVTNFGVFVQHPRYLIDGLLRIEHLGDDWWDVDLRTGRVVGERSGRVFAMGTGVTVLIAAVDLAARQLNLSLPVQEQREAPKAGRPRKSRKAAKPGRVVRKRRRG